MAQEKPRKKLSKKQNDLNYKSLYDPVFAKLYGKAEELGNDVEMLIWDKLQDPKAGEDRSIPPLDSVLKEMQSKINTMTDNELKNLISSKNIGDVIKNKPSNTSVLDLYKYQKHIRGLIDAGYTFEDGGILPMKKAKKKKYNLGGNPLDPYAQAAGMAGGLVNAIAPENSIGGGIASGALQGAATGAAFGPIGAGAGALIGGVSGWLGAKKGKEQEAKLQTQQNALIKHNLLQNAQQPQLMKNGGMLANKLNVVQGGSLEQISPDAVEVNANNPSITDSVELDNAFVDNNEIIDRKDRVFSDELLGPSGRSIAKEAKKLEKMKSKNARFNDSNTRIDQKLDELFNYQESMKSRKPKMRFDLGGSMTDPNNTSPTFKTKAEHTAYYTKELEAKMQSQMPDLYTKYLESVQLKNQADIDTSLAAAGGIPMFTAPKTTHVPSNPTDWSKLGFSNEAPEGFRYSINKPDKESITNKMALGGTLRKPKPKLSDGYDPFNPSTPKLKKDNINLNPNPIGFGGGFDRFALPELPVTTTTSNPSAPIKTSMSFKGANSAPFSHSLDTNSVEDGFADLSNTPGKKSSFNWANAANTFSTFAPNIANSFLQKKLKGPAAPQLESITRFERVNPNAQLADTARQANMTNSLIMKNTSQGSNLSSSLGSVLAKRLAANNQIHGQTQNINAGIQANEAQLNQGVKARNTERTNSFRNDVNSFSNKKLAMTSENIANASAKIQSQNKEKSLMNLDRDKFAIIQSRFEDLPAAMKAKYPTVFDYYNSPEYKDKNLLGGYLSRKKKPNINSGGKLKKGYC